MQCSSSCGGGVQQRQVRCEQKITAFTIQIHLSYSPGGAMVMLLCCAVFVDVWRRSPAAAGALRADHRLHNPDPSIVFARWSHGDAAVLCSVRRRAAAESSSGRCAASRRSPRSRSLPFPTRAASPPTPGTATSRHGSRPPNNRATSATVRHGEPVSSFVVVDSALWT